MKFIIKIIAFWVITAYGWDVYANAQSWSWPGDLREHMHEHGVNAEGKSYDQLRIEHDFIHNITNQNIPNSDDYKLLTQYCPGGNCPPSGGGFGFGIGGGFYSNPSPNIQPNKPNHQEKQHPCILQVRALLTNGKANVGSGCVIAIKSGYSYIITVAHYGDSAQSVRQMQVGYNERWYKCEVLYRNDDDDVMLLKCKDTLGNRVFEVAAEAPTKKVNVIAISLLNGFVRTQRGWIAKTVYEEQGSRTIHGNRYITNIVFQSGQSGGVVLYDNKVVGLISGSDNSEGVLVDWNGIVKALNGWKSNSPKTEPENPPYTKPEPSEPEPKPTLAPEYKLRMAELESRHIILSQKMELLLKSDFGCDCDKIESIKDIKINEGHLLIIMSSGKIIDAGKMPVATNGNDGVSILSAKIENENLVLIRSDGKIIDAGKLPKTDTDLGDLPNRINKIEEKIEEPFEAQLFTAGQASSSIRKVNPHGGWLPINVPVYVRKDNIWHEVRDGKLVPLKSSEVPNYLTLED